MRGAVINNPRGVNPGPPDTAFVFNRRGAAVSVGDVVMLDLGQTATETTGIAFSDEAGVWANVVLPATAQLGYGIFAIVSDLMGGAGADNTLIQVTFVSPAITANVTGTAALYETCTAVNAADTLAAATGTGGQKIVGIALTTTAGAGELPATIMFDGWHGFGQSNEA